MNVRPVEITIRSTQKIINPTGKADPGTLLKMHAANSGAVGKMTLSEISKELSEAARACADEYDDLLPFEDEGNGESRIEFSSAAQMKTRGKLVEISYEESKLTGMEGTVTSVIFSKDDPQTVRVRRKGTVASDMLFSEGTRNTSVYATSVMPFRICLDTKKVSNGVTFENGGVIELLYRIEVNANLVQSNRFRITVKCK